MIVAGQFGGDDPGDAGSVPAVLYSWLGEAQVRVKGVDRYDISPEVPVIYPNEESSFQVLSDDGHMDVVGTKCKDVSTKGIGGS